jgi:hypothetical protein
MTDSSGRYLLLDALTTLVNARTVLAIPARPAHWARRSGALACPFPAGAEGLRTAIFADRNVTVLFHLFHCLPAVLTGPHR